MSELYFGAPGGQVEIHHPRGGVLTTRDRPASTFRTGSGGARVGHTIGGKRQFTLNWQRLWYEDYARLEAYHHGHNGPGPFVIHDPGRVNWLAVNQSSATSHLNDVDGFSLSATGSNLSSSASAYHRGPRALRWDKDSNMSLPGVTGSYASTPDAAALDVGNLEIRLDLQAYEWAAGVYQGLVTKWVEGTDQRSYGLYLDPSGFLELDWSSDGTSAGIVGEVCRVPVPVGDGERAALRAILDTDLDGAYVVYFDVGETIEGPWTALDEIHGTTTTSVFAGTALLEVGSQDGGGLPLAGIVYSARVTNTDTSTVVANPRFDHQAAGTTSFTDSAGRVWTLNGTAAIQTAQSILTLDSVTPTWPGIPVLAGQSLCLSVYVLVLAEVSAVTITPRFVWMDAAGEQVGTTSGLTTGLTDSWQQLALAATPPVGAVYLLCTYVVDGVGALFLDEFQLERGSAASAWRPGTGVYPVAVISLTEQWPWQAEGFREKVTLVLQEVGP